MSAQHSSNPKFIHFFDEVRGKSEKRKGAVLQVLPLRIATFNDVIREKIMNLIS